MPSRPYVRAATACVLAGLSVAAAAGIGLGITVGARAASADAPLPPPVPGPVVLIGTSGVTWAEVSASRTPTLWAMLDAGASGSLAVHGVHVFTCPVDGWLAVSSGRLAAAPRPPQAAVTAPACPALEQPTGGAPSPAWPGYVAAAADNERDAQLGLLGATLESDHLSAVGIGPGAAVALADPDGTSSATLQPAPTTNIAFSAAVATSAGADLVVVDLGGVTDPAADPNSRLVPVAEQLTSLDARLGAVLTALPSSATVLVASLADAGTDPHLQVLAARGPASDGSSYARELLGSRSTRQPGLVQGTDLAPTLLSLLGVAAPAGFVGAPITALDPSGTAADRLQRLRDYDAAAQKVEPYAFLFFTGMIVLQVLWYVIAGLELRRRATVASTSRRLRWLHAVQWIAVGFAAVPVATFPANLVPWWRSVAPLPVLVGLVVAGAAVVTVIAMRGPWRRSLLGPLGVVAGATAIVIAADVLTGSRLMIGTLLGSKLLVGARFYGLGNVAFALFATGSLLAAAVLADTLVRNNRRAAACAAVVAIGVLAVAIDGTPGLGSDLGGPIAMVPAFTTLALTVAQVRISWRTALSIAGLTGTIVVTLAILDYLRPVQDRTHLGAFVAAVLDGEAVQVISRKLHENLGVLGGSLVAVLVPIVVAILVLVVVRPRTLGLSALPRAYDRAPALRPGLVAFLLLLALGFAFNDSGAVVPAVAAAVVVPLMVAVGARVREREIVMASAGLPPPLAAPAPTD